MIFRAGQFEFTFPRPTMIMGVVNVTPDSFSDGGRFLDPAGAVAEAQAGYVCMHMQGTPQTMQVNPVYQDVVQEVRGFFVERLERLQRAGVDAVQVVLDPGLGFGKTVEHNLLLLAGVGRFTKLRRPVLLGVSRKSFIGKLLGPEVSARLPAALACA